MMKIILAFLLLFPNVSQAAEHIQFNIVAGVFTLLCEQCEESNCKRESSCMPADMVSQTEIMTLSSLPVENGVFRRWLSPESKIKLSSMGHQFDFTLQTLWDQPYSPQAQPHGNMSVKIESTLKGHEKMDLVLMFKESPDESRPGGILSIHIPHETNPKRSYLYRLYFGVPSESEERAPFIKSGSGPK